MFNRMQYLQLFVEYENRDVHIHIHLHNFDEKNAQRVFMEYVEKYRDKEIHRLFVRFWEKSIAGGYLSLVRKNNYLSFLSEPISGFKYVKLVYDYINTLSDIGNVSVVI